MKSKKKKGASSELLTCALFEIIVILNQFSAEDRGLLIKALVQK